MADEDSLYTSANKNIFKLFSKMYFDNALMNFDIFFMFF